MFYSKPFDDCSLGSGEWFENLAVHEYRHIVQYDVLNHGFTKLASFIFGAYGRSTLSYSVPQWFYEGDAVFAETDVLISTDLLQQLFAKKINFTNSTKWF